MPTFAYKGRNTGGQLIEGVLDGANAGAVVDLLLGQGLTPVEINETKAKAAKTPVGLNVTLFKQKVTHIDLLLFSRQMHTLLKSGVPIMRALNGLQDAAINPEMKRVIGEVRESLEGGRELSQALARHPRVFSSFYLSMVRVGEATGLLEEIFFRLFEHLEFERYMREQVKTALRYPMFVVIAMAVALVIVNLFVIPAFAKVFAGFGAELPLMTQVLLGFSNFMVAYWPLMLAGVIGGIVAFRAWVGTVTGRYDWDRMSLKFPIAGKILHKAALSRFARSFSLAIRSGVPVMQALSNSAQTVDNSYVSRCIEGMRENVERGESLLRATISAGIFTPVVLQMVAVGEESGAVDDMMNEIGDMYRQEVEYELKTLGQQIEPILIVMLGVMVLILALGIFLPMWDLGKVAIKR
ncbi:type II secretion system F family protein [Propionivibrio sp.]|uniref:type II secretion system F family protein n=1 Tax=Propionivibrio sp. TaxID=2212460 RepID=UPI0025DC7FEC|nr:type II secretion system F family protein [Propionivibrio sp.]MBK7355369.1 type II secretion system F family protein [Propionivibrio sp.]MBK8743339.1 type II secretion system F family protein [Propionivibrio sp.]MBK8894637.1 type II secretion system F family protein [Propionivibrio sp.]MBL0207120.1 type II secretion system F family protein [Propionivibrio sp.]